LLAFFASCRMSAAARAAVVMVREYPWLRALIVLLVMAVGLHLAGLLWDLALRFGDVIILFLLAWLIAFVLRPLARALSSAGRVPWALSVAAVYIIFFALAVGLGVVLIPLLVAQLTELAVATPSFVQQLVNWYTDLQSSLPEQLQAANLANIISTRDLVAQGQQIATTALQNAVGLATSVASTLLGLSIVLVVSFYLTLDGERITRQTIRAMPPTYREEVRFLLDSVERSFGGFLRGQLIQAFAYATGTAVVMQVAGLQFIVVSTTIAALAMVVPFFGPIIAIVPPLLLAMAQGGVTLALQVFVALLILQQIVFNVLAPKVMSDAVGLHPLLVLLAILVGGKAAGLAGAIFGVPVTAVLVALFGFFYQRLAPNTEPAAEQEPGTLPPRAPSAATLRAIWRNYVRRNRQSGHDARGG
jgi:predicted PurR-regulated permease PerM